MCVVVLFVFASHKIESSCMCINIYIYIYIYIYSQQKAICYSILNIVDQIRKTEDLLEDNILKGMLVGSRVLRKII